MTVIIDNIGIRLKAIVLLRAGNEKLTEDSITKEASLANDLCLDTSEDGGESNLLLMDIEKEFDIKISLADDTFDNIATFGELLSYVTRKVEEK